MSANDDATVNALRGDVALQIARITNRTGTTQSAMARRLGIPQPTLSKIVNGHVSEISLELLIRVAVRAGLPIAFQTGRDPAEAGAFVATPYRRQPLSSRSTVGAAARESLLQAERRRTPSQRLEAYLEHNQILALLRQAGRAAEFQLARRKEERS